MHVHTIKYVRANQVPTKKDVSRETHDVTTK